MNKKITYILAVILFLIQIIPLAGLAPAENLSTNMITITGAAGANLQFKDTGNFLRMALSLYRFDAFKGMPKDEPVRAYSSTFSGSDEILNDCKIKPNKIYHTFLTDKSV